MDKVETEIIDGVDGADSLRARTLEVLDASVAFRFFSVPAHHLTPQSQQVASDELLEPELPYVHEAIEKALTGAEYRDMRARDRLLSVLGPDQPERNGPPGEGYGNSAVFAQPPQDLPALLRLADQLDMLAEQETGEQALVWKCADCSTRYAVPVALVRRVAIRCERCGHPVELHTELSLGEESLLDPSRVAVNKVRRELAGFFRDAMARGWPVMVAATERS